MTETCIPSSTNEFNYNGSVRMPLHIYETYLKKINNIFYSMPAKVSNRKKKVPDEPSELIQESETNDDTKPRGRKPRSSKIVSKQKLQPQQPTPVSNIILHLKCSLNDLNEYNTRLSKIMTNPLEYNPEIPPEVTTYDMMAQPFSAFDHSDINDANAQTNSETWLQTKDPVCKVCTCENVVVDTNDNINTKEMNAKL